VFEIPPGNDAVSIRVLCLTAERWIDASFLDPGMLDIYFNRLPSKLPGTAGAIAHS
jgi:hypothetical protein